MVYHGNLNALKNRHYIARTYECQFGILPQGCFYTETKRLITDMLLASCYFIALIWVLISSVNERMAWQFYIKVF
ncbi:MAG: hypothetical protein Q4P13_03255 [Psychrobacter sp.]|nr:hypothetical protein [Psychrobacter sp.]